MDEIREVTVFAIGDSSKIKTWSNVPYFFTEALLQMGIKVNRVDISPSRLLNKIYNETFGRVITKIHKDTSYSYFRSLFNFIHIKQRIKHTGKKYRNSDLNIFLTFSFSSAGLSKQPSVQLCDWTYDHHIMYFNGRKPDRFENASIQREDTQIEGTDLVFSLFPGITEYMKRRYKNKNIFYLGNFINSLETPVEAQILEKKSNSKSLLFIGSEKYLEGARSLIKAYENLKSEEPGLELNIVGISEKYFSLLPAGVKCYGYLDKEKIDEKELYYKLLRDAKVYINTSPKWGGYSSTIEAMYFYCPVIVSPYNEFVETFGKEISFGEYCPNNSAELLRANIKKLITCPTYKTSCINAHDSVKESTWSAYVEKMLNIIKVKL